MHAHVPPFTRSSQEPTGAYRAPSEISEVEACLRTAQASLRNAAECVDKALAAHLAKSLAKALHDDKLSADVTWSAKRGDHVPKWHAGWGERDAHLPPNLTAAVSAPNCDGNAALLKIGIGDVGPRHPMHAETLRDADEYSRGSGETGV